MHRSFTIAGEISAPQAGGKFFAECTSSNRVGGTESIKIERIGESDSAREHLRDDAEAPREHHQDVFRGSDLIAGR
jgi:hypothetical protein